MVVSILKTISCLYSELLRTDAEWYSFYINLPLGACAAAVIWLAFKPPKAAAPTPGTAKEKCLQMDILGVILISASIICFSLSLRWAGIEKEWNHPHVIGLLVGTLLLIIAFIGEQWFQGDRALLMRTHLRNRTLLVGAMFEFL
jgi:hypothetical protein